MWEVSKNTPPKEEGFFTIDRVDRGGGSHPLGVKESQKVAFKLRQ